MAAGQYTDVAEGVNDYFEEMTKIVAPRDE